MNHQGEQRKWSAVRRSRLGSNRRLPGKGADWLLADWSWVTGRAGWVAWWPPESDMVSSGKTTDQRERGNPLRSVDSILAMCLSLSTFSYALNQCSTSNWDNSSINRQFPLWIIALCTWDSWIHASSRIKVSRSHAFRSTFCFTCG